MDQNEFLAEQFEEHRAHLRAVAYRMLGSLSEAEDAVQEAWLRLARNDTEGVENMGGWLTTVTARVCLNMLRSRASRREVPLDVHIPDPVVSSASGLDPEHEALLADSVGLALLTVLELLAARRAPGLRPARHVRSPVRRDRPDRRPDADGRAPAREPGPEARPGDADSARPRPGRQREVVDAFFAAARAGDFERLVAVLDPDVVSRSDAGELGPGGSVRGARSGGGRPARADVRPARPLRPAGARQRRGRRRRRARGPPVLGHGLHRQRRPHRRDRRDHGPRAAEPDGSRVPR